jgi:hypothetical protein
MALMRAHTVTLYNSLGEADRQMTYARTVLTGVRVEESSGAVASLAGKASTDGITLYIPGSTPGYVEPTAYAGSGWTLKDGDIIAIGDAGSDIPPGTVQELAGLCRVYRIKGVERFSLRGDRVHHWEVAGS